MIVVCLTGGIGSGKTTVAKEFQKLGIPIYVADEEAKKLMVTSNDIKKKLIDLFGKNTYLEGRLNRKFIADIIFNDKDYLDKINAIVHPEVSKHFQKWLEEQKSQYVIKEVAILFENGGYKNCDFIITVTAPKETKINRLLKRDQTTAKRIEAIMKNQWEDEDRKGLSDFIIENTDLEKTRYQVAKIHHQIMSKIRD